MSVKKLRNIFYLEFEDVIIEAQHLFMDFQTECCWCSMKQVDF